MAAQFYRERLAARAENTVQEIVLLHGWAASSDCWRSALSQLRRYFNVTLVDLPGHGKSADYEVGYNQFLKELMPQLPEKACYLGWSLGGMIATDIAGRFPDRVAALINIAANPSFVQRAGWRAAMPEAVFADFCQRFELNPVKGLRRFDMLQWQGDEFPVKASSRLCNGAAQRQLLDWLAEIDNRKALRKLDCPALSIFAENDALVPVEAREALIQLNPQIETNLVPAAGHVPFISRPESVWEIVKDFCERNKLLPQKSESARDKRSVAQSFSRAAQSYDGVASLQRRVADHLLSLAESNQRYDAMLDMGCGTGYSLPALQERANTVFALDLAEGMLSYAKQRPDRAADAWLCGDAEDLPLADESLDGIFSSFSVQWCENIAAVFAEGYRVLKPGGKLLLSTLGPETLHELKTAGEQADGRTHVNQFVPRQQIQKGIERSGLVLEQWQESVEVLHYRELRELMSELKQLGAHNVNAGRNDGLMGKRALRRFVQAYEQFRQDGLLPASYQVWYLTLVKPEN